MRSKKVMKTTAEKSFIRFFLAKSERQTLCMSDDAVSSVVGEMLMLTIVLLLVGIFSLSVSNFVPSDREPVANILVGDVDTSGYNFTLWHKGGDILRINDLKIILNIDGNLEYITYSERNNAEGVRPLVINNDTSVTKYMAGDFLTINSPKRVNGAKVQIAALNGIIFTGLLKGNRS